MVSVYATYEDRLSLEPKHNNNMALLHSFANYTSLLSACLVFIIYGCLFHNLMKQHWNMQFKRPETTFLWEGVPFLLGKVWNIYSHPFESWVTDIHLLSHSVTSRQVNVSEVLPKQWDAIRYNNNCHPSVLILLQQSAWQSVNRNHEEIQQKCDKPIDRDSRRFEHAVAIN